MTPTSPEAIKRVREQLCGHALRVGPTVNTDCAEAAALIAALAAERDAANAALAGARRDALDDPPITTWANTLANIRQGRSSEPRCEPPEQFAIDRAIQDVVDVLKARASLQDTAIRNLGGTTDE